MPEYTFQCGRENCRRIFRRIEGVVFYSDRKEVAKRGALAKVAEINRDDVDPMFRSVAEMQLRRMKRDIEPWLEKMREGKLTEEQRGFVAERIDESDTALPFPCTFCGFGFAFRHYLPGEAPFVAKEAGVWPADAPSALAGKSFNSTQERREQVAALTPNLVPREDVAAVSERKRKVQTREVVVAGAPKVVPERSAEDRVRIWFQGHDGAHSASKVAEETNLGIDVVLAIVRTDKYRRLLGGAYRLLDAPTAAPAA